MYIYSLYYVPMSIAADKKASAQIVPAESLAGPVLPSGVTLELDDNGYLYDPWFRDLIRKKVSPSQTMDQQTQLDTEAVRAVAICGKVLHQAFEDSLHEIGVTHQQYKTMMCILSRGEEGTQLHPIAEWLGVSPRNVTALVDALEAQGLVERMPDATDRRAVIARLTGAGREKAMAGQRVNRADLKRVMGSLSADEKLQLRHLTLKLLAAAAGTAVERRRKSDG